MDTFYAVAYGCYFSKRPFCFFDDPQLCMCNIKMWAKDVIYKIVVPDLLSLNTSCHWVIIITAETTIIGVTGVNLT